MVTTRSASAISLAQTSPPIRWPLIELRSVSDTPRESPHGAQTYTGTRCSTIRSKRSVSGGNPIPWIDFLTGSRARYAPSPSKAIWGWSPLSNAEAAPMKGRVGPWSWVGRFDLAATSHEAESGRPQPDAKVIWVCLRVGEMTVLKSIGLFVAAALAEIGGAYLIWQGVREKRGLLFIAGGVMALALYGFVATFQPSPHFGRILAAYGGVFVVGSLLWGVVFDGFRPDGYDVAGALICLLGVVIIMYAPRASV